MPFCKVVIPAFVKNFEKIVTQFTKCCYNTDIEKRDVVHGNLAENLLFTRVSSAKFGH